MTETIPQPEREVSMEWLEAIFKRSPEIALFLSLALGYLVGRLLK